MAIVSDQVKRLQEQGWSLSAMADELKVNRQTLARWRDGEHEPHHARLISPALTRLLRKRDVPKQRRYKTKRQRAEARPLDRPPRLTRGERRRLIAKWTPALGDTVPEWIAAILAHSDARDQEDLGRYVDNWLATGVKSIPLASEEGLARLRIATGLAAQALPKWRNSRA